MSDRLRVLLVAVGMAFLALAGSASAGIDPISGTVANGNCDAPHAVTVSAATRIEMTVSSTAQNNTSLLAEIVLPNGQFLGAPSTISYDTPGAGSYSVRVCVTYAEQNPPQVQYTGKLGTGPAGQPVLTGPAQPPASTTTGASTKPFVASGKASIMTRSGLASFTVGTSPNASLTLKIFDPVHRVTRSFAGLKGTYTGKTLRITGKGLTFVLVQTGVPNRVTFTSSGFTASGKVVRGAIHVTA